MINFKSIKKPMPKKPKIWSTEHCNNAIRVDSHRQCTS